MKKRVLSLLLCLVMALSLIPSVAFATTHIDTVNIIGMKTPLVGRKAGDCLDLSPADPTYTITDAFWYCKTDSCKLFDGGEFEAGKVYYLSIEVAPADGYAVSGLTEFLLNGSTAVVNSPATWVYDGNLKGFSADITAVDKPAAPKITGLSNGNTGITVKWSKIADADGYQIYRKAGSATSWGNPVKTITSGTTTSWGDTGRTSGTKYQYKMRAYKIVDGTRIYGAYSAISTWYFMAQPKISSITNTKDGITVKWGKVAGATVYKVYRKVGSGEWKQLATTTATSYNNTGLTNGTKYQYKIVAVKMVDSANYQSGASSIKTMYRLTRPTLASGTKNIATRKIVVTWNRNTKVTGYQVKYVKGTTTKTVTVKGASTLSKTLSSLTKGSTYKIYVRSYKTVSGTNYYSAWSGYKSVKVVK